jgi:DNA-binding transcriptional regulator YiaG
VDAKLIERAVKLKGGVARVAEALGVSRQAVYYWLSGEREPGEDALRYLGLVKVERLAWAKPVKRKAGSGRDWGALGRLR